MTEFDNEPFARIYQALDNINAAKPEDLEMGGIERLEDVEQRKETVKQSKNYVRQARRLLQGAKKHGSREAYELAEDSIDDLQQNLQILAPVYREQIQEAKAQIPYIWSEKRKTMEKLEEDPSGITDREYNQLLMDLEGTKIPESTPHETLEIAHNTYYRPRFEGVASDE